MMERQPVEEDYLSKFNVPAFVQGSNDRRVFCRRAGQEILPLIP
jgi:hypothetical protein